MKNLIENAEVWVNEEKIVNNYVVIMHDKITGKTVFLTKSISKKEAEETMIPKSWKDNSKIVLIKDLPKDLKNKVGHREK